MKKKFLALLLSASLAAVMMTGCGNNNEPEATTSTEESVSVEESKESDAAAEELPAAAVHLTFDGDDEGYKALVQTEDVGDNDGANYGLAETDVTFQFSTGPVGNAIYLDGSYGLDLGLKATNTDTYTVSFWVNADRLSTYGPTLQMGYNMGKAENAGNDVTWLNVTQNEFGDNSAKIFPIVWSRNEASDAADGIDCWPWMYSFDNEIHGKREWTMVTIVCTGEVQNSPVGSTTVGAQFYVDGVMTYDSQDNYANSTYFEYTWDATLAPNIMQPGSSEFESLFGINYWDTIFKGFVDDLYIYDTALTPGQITSLYQLGDPNVESIAPEGSAEVEEEAAAQVVTTIDDSAIAIVGTPNCDNAFWTSFSDAYELKDGDSLEIHFNNYGSGLSNWENYLVVFTNTATTADLVPSAENYDGYMEYGVVRSDSFGWAFPNDAPVFMEGSWEWDNFISIMMDADVTLTISRSGSDIAIDGAIIDADGNEYTYKVESDTTAASGDPMYVVLSGEKCYIEILSVK